MPEEKKIFAAIEEQLETLQKQIRVVTQKRAELLKTGDTAELGKVNQELSELRNQRQALLDKQLHLQRHPITDDVVEEGKSVPLPSSMDVTPVRPVVRGAQGKPPLKVRILTLLLVFGGVAAVSIGGIYYITERILAPAPIAGLDNGGAGNQENLGFDFSPLGLYLSTKKDIIRKPASDDPTPVHFRVELGETGTTIARRLEEEGLVTDGEVFRRLLQYRGADQSIEAGLFELSPNMTMDEIIEVLREGRIAEVQITIPEGWRAGQIAALLEEQGIVTAEAYMALVRDPSHFDYEFLKDLPEGSTLEGYLFPDTYSFVEAEVTAEQIIEKQLENFDRRIERELRQSVSAKDMTLHQAVILASLVEREAVVAEEREVIAGVYINRWKDNILLNADPTIQYALRLIEDSAEWWPQLSEQDLKLDSPYNTYLYRGLPPGPIANPGLDSITATILAPDTPYYYFVSRNDGTHVFAETLEEHIQNVNEYQNGESNGG